MSQIFKKEIKNIDLPESYSNFHSSPLVNILSNYAITMNLSIQRTDLGLCFLNDESAYGKLKWQQTYHLGDSTVTLFVSAVDSMGKYWGDIMVTGCNLQEVNSIADEYNNKLRGDNFKKQEEATE